MNQSLMNMLSEVAGHCGISFRSASRMLGIARSSHSRWRKRTKENIPLVLSPGPKKMDLLDMQALYLDIAALHHATHRTLGTTALYEQYNSAISRRDFQELVHDERVRQVTQERDGYERIKLFNAGIIWAMDDTMLDRSYVDGKCLWVNHVRDIGAHYSFSPLCGPTLACGGVIACHLDWLFERNGAPLFLKRDNHGNLNNAEVDRVLAEHCVIPFNSPPYYPRYNGAMERSQATLKDEVELQLAGNRWMPDTVAPFVKSAAHEINHRSLQTLDGSCPCHFRTTKMITYTKNERKGVYDWIMQSRNSILDENQEKVSVASALRLAVTVWLVGSGLMSINRHRKCHPINQG